jgi:hypothetical protein
MAEQELDLIELAACQVAKARACTPYSTLRRYSRPILLESGQSQRPANLLFCISVVLSSRSKDHSCSLDSRLGHFFVLRVQLLGT